MQNVATIATIHVKRLPEGVYLATSDDVPGLVVESDSRDQIIDLAQDLANELLDERGVPPHQRPAKFSFLFE
jgi:hypothetical protein